MALSIEDQVVLRLHILNAIEAMATQRGGFLTWGEITSFKLHGTPRPLAGQRGIFNPNYFDHTLSITSSPDGPYDDVIGADGLLHYRFEAGDPRAGANRKLRQTIIDSVPIILFRRPESNLYIPFVPAYVVDEDLQGGYVKVATGEEFRAIHQSGLENLNKEYVQQIVKRRVHQPEFRARVIRAYGGSCAICRLNHRELLDAAHIIPDSLSHSTAEVSNGLSLCKIHHAAYDSHLLGIDPTCKVHINKTLLLEEDGPMLRHGLQEMHGVSLTVPLRKSEKPNPIALEERFSEFSRIG